MRLSIIIVNYKAPQLVINCLNSVYKYNTNNVEIFVVDNDSNDGLESILQNEFPDIFFIQMGYNAGFARANNAAIKVAKGDNILLLNSDTINIDNAINKCDKLLRESLFSAAGVQLLNEDSTPQISGNYAMKGGLNYLLPLPFTGAFLKAIANVLKVTKPSVASTKKTIEVDWINGAFLMVKNNVIPTSGLLDEDFFLYAEEAEWCSRIKRNGKLCIFGELNIYHLQGVSSNKAFGSEGKGYFNLFDKKGLQIMLSNFVRIRKRFGLFWFLFDLVFYLLTVPVFFTCVIFSKLSSNSKYNFKQVKGFSKNIFSLAKFIPSIIKNKPFFYKVL